MVVGNPERFTRTNVHRHGFPRVLIQYGQHLRPLLNSLFTVRMSMVKVSVIPEGDGLVTAWWEYPNRKPLRLLRLIHSPV